MQLRVMCGLIDAPLAGPGCRVRGMTAHVMCGPTRAALVTRWCPVPLCVVYRYEHVLSHATNHCVVVLREMCFSSPLLARAQVSPFASKAIVEFVYVVWPRGMGGFRSVCAGGGGGGGECRSLSFPSPY